MYHGDTKFTKRRKKMSFRATDAAKVYFGYFQKHRIFIAMLTLKCQDMRLHRRRDKGIFRLPERTYKTHSALYAERVLFFGRERQIRGEKR